MHFYSFYIPELRLFHLCSEIHKYLFVIFLLFSNLNASPTYITNIRIFDTNKQEFSDPRIIKIKSDIIEEIQTSKSKKIEYYALPSFCDMAATLTVNPLGGSNSIKELELSLKSYIYHGFTHIHLINNPLWLRDYLNKYKGPLPNISYSDRIIINSTTEYEKLPEEIYFSSSSGNEMIKEINHQISNNNLLIFIYNRFYNNDEFYPNQDNLREIKFLNEKNSKIIISNFGNYESIMDSIRSGNIFLKDPIPEIVFRNLSESKLSSLNYIPEINVYYNLKVTESKEELLNEINFLSGYFPFFKNNYKNITIDYYNNKNYNILSYDKLNKELESYTNGIKNYKNKINKIYASGGAGNIFSFPGISAIRELQLISGINHLNEGNINLLLDVCKLAFNDYDGTIHAGGKANFLLYKKNPLVKSDIFPKPDEIYLNGKQIKVKF